MALYSNLDIFVHTHIHMYVCTYISSCIALEKWQVHQSGTTEWNTKPKPENSNYYNEFRSYMHTCVHTYSGKVHSLLRMYPVGKLINMKK